MTKADAERLITEVLAIFEAATGSSVVGIDLEVDTFMVHAINDQPSKARKIGAQIKLLGGARVGKTN